MAAVRAHNLDYILGMRLRAAEELRAAISADTTPYAAFEARYRW